MAFPIPQSLESWAYFGWFHDFARCHDENNEVMLHQDSIKKSSKTGSLFAGYVPNRLYGGAGSDWLFGGAGSDWLYGGAGSDWLFGGAGSDWLYGGAGSDWLFGGAGSDWLYGGAGSDWLFGGVGSDWLYGGAGSDWLFGGVGSDRLYGGAGSDWLFGGAGADRLYGGAGSDWLFGGAGSDWLYGGAGSDWLFGGAGSDLMLYLHDPNAAIDRDFYDGEAGQDTIVIAIAWGDYEVHAQKIYDAFLQITPKSNQKTTIEFDQGASLTFKGIEDARVAFSGGGLKVRSFDGSDNNLVNSDWGKAHTQLLRLTSIAYEDGESLPRGDDGITDKQLPSPREISNTVLAQAEPIPNKAHVSDWFWQWGQFIDHDISLTKSAEPDEPFNISVPKGDPDFDPFGTGNQTIPLNRSIAEVDRQDVRQQINDITAFIDASMVYGSDAATALNLRTQDGTGKLKTSRQIGIDNREILLPIAKEKDAPDFREGVDFLAGDIRGNEQLGLISVHTLFVREHNRLANDIAGRLTADLADTNSEVTDIEKLFHDFEVGFVDPNPNDHLTAQSEFIYQAARSVVGAEIQHITYNEFLPLMLGENGLCDYQGYNPTVNPGIANEFSTAAFRFGHTMLSPHLLRIGADAAGEFTVEQLSLFESFFNPDEIRENGVDTLLVGLSKQKAQEYDHQLIDDVRNLLFGPPGAGGFDLAALNIQRGRDHGLPDYLSVRQQLDLSQDLTDLTEAARHSITDAYPELTDIDLWLGGISEKPVNGGIVGQTFHHIIKDQFTRLRDGDRFFYKNHIDTLETIANGSTTITLSQVIKNNLTDGPNGELVSQIANDVFRIDSPFSRV